MILETTKQYSSWRVHTPALLDRHNPIEEAVEETEAFLEYIRTRQDGNGRLPSADGQ